MNMPYLVEIYFSCEHLYYSLIFFSSNLHEMFESYTSAAINSYLLRLLFTYVI